MRRPSPVSLAGSSLARVRPLCLDHRRALRDVRGDRSERTCPNGLVIGRLRIRRRAGRAPPRAQRRTNRASGRSARPSNAVAVRGLRDKNGEEIPASPRFRGLRDERTTDVPQLEAERARDDESSAALRDVLTTEIRGSRPSAHATKRALRRRPPRGSIADRGSRRGKFTRDNSGGPAARLHGGHAATRGDRPARVGSSPPARCMVRGARWEGHVARDMASGACPSGHGVEGRL